MIDETSGGSQQFPDQLSQGDIGIKGTQDFTNPQPNYQDPFYQPPMGPPGTYYPPGTKTRFPLIPVNPYSKGLAISVIMMVIGVVIEKFFARFDSYYYDYARNPIYYLGMVIFYIGGLMAFLYALGLFLLPPGRDQSASGSSNVHLGLAFLLGAIILAIALH